MVCEKDMLAVSWVISGTHKGEFWGIPPTNKKISMEGITINHIADGKIMDSDVSMDALGLMRQLGAFPAAEKSKGTSAS
jgi:predicted ester cyclase